jgi:hypothetical protein
MLKNPCTKRGEDPSQELVPHRAVVQENKMILSRRWHAAKSFREGDISPSRFDAIFPNQRGLLKMLESVDESQIVSMSEVGWPLFRLACDNVEFSKVHHVIPSLPLGSADSDAEREIFGMLLCRRETIAEFENKALVQYGLTRRELNGIGQCTSLELQALSRAPGFSVYQRTSNRYFQYVIEHPTASIERKQYFACLAEKS